MATCKQGPEEEKGGSSGVLPNQPCFGLMPGVASRIKKGGFLTINSVLSFLFTVISLLVLVLFLIIFGVIFLILLILDVPTIDKGLAPYSLTLIGILRI